MAKSSKLVEEMVVQILSRLPPKSLLRFKCVGKQWCDLINSPKFVAKHISNSKHKLASSTRILFKHTVLKDTSITDEEEIRNILFDGNSNKKEILFSFLDISNDSVGDDSLVHSAVEDLKVPEPMNACALSLEFCGHCDGLICLRNYDDENLVLCNPSIKEFRVLPKSLLIVPLRELNEDDPMDDYFFDEEASTKAVGFGYDSKTKTYKVVRIVSFMTGIACELPSRVEMFNLGDDSWREIETCIPCHAYFSPSFQLHFKGIFYWWARGPEDREAIMSFDFGDEVFHHFQVPENFHGDANYRSLAVWEESIALLSYEMESGVPKTLDIWLLGEDSGGANGPWTKHMTIGPLNGVEIPLVFWKRDELLMVTTDGRVVSYNLGTQALKSLPINGMEGPIHIQAVVYVNSLLSTNGDNKLEDTDM